MTLKLIVDHQGGEDGYRRHRVYEADVGSVFASDGHNSGSYRYLGFIDGMDMEWMGADDHTVCVVSNDINFINALQMFTYGAVYGYDDFEGRCDYMKEHWFKGMTFDDGEAVEGGCPKCHHPGKFVRMALCCPEHGAFGGL